MEEEIIDIATLPSQTFAGQNSHSGLLWRPWEILGTLSEYFYFPRHAYFA